MSVLNEADIITFVRNGAIKYRFKYIRNNSFSSTSSASTTTVTPSSPAVRESPLVEGEAVPVVDIESSDEEDSNDREPLLLSLDPPEAVVGGDEAASSQPVSLPPSPSIFGATPDPKSS